MDGELGIYNKLGGGDKYRNVSSMDGGGTKVDKKKDRIKRLEKKIETREFFYPLHLQPCYNNLNIIQNNYPIAENIYNKGISLPSSYSLTKSQTEYIITCINNYFLNK